jgi:hypothetical protein
VIVNYIKDNYCFMPVSCLAYFPRLKEEAICSSETSLTSKGLHGVMPEKTIVSLVDAVAIR